MIEGRYVAPPAQAADLAHGDIGDDGVVAELLAGVDVGDMDLDDGQLRRGQSVAQGQAVVGEGAGVDYDAVGPCAFGLKEIDDGAFAVGLEAASTCVKALAVWFDDCDTWFLLAEIHAATGDFGRAARLLQQAERSAKRTGIRPDSPDWKPRVDQLRQQIKHRQYAGLPSRGQLMSDYLRANQERSK